MNDRSLYVGYSTILLLHLINYVELIPTSHCPVSSIASYVQVKSRLKTYV